MAKALLPRPTPAIFAAELLLLVVAAAAVLVNVAGVEALVELLDATVVVAVSFWKNTCGPFDKVVLVLVVLYLELVETNAVVELLVVVVVLLVVVEVVVGLGVVVVVDVVDGVVVVDVVVVVGLGDGVVVVVVVLEDDDLAALELPDDDDDDELCPALNTTMLALPPLGTVTTQKLAPPAPEAESGDVTPFTGLTDGSIEHGRPLQFPSGHSILMPQDGEMLLKLESSV